VKLILFHPQLLKRTCARCQTWLFDDAHSILTRAGQPLRRPDGSVPPCWKCPKQSPAHARGYERDMDRIVRTLALYFQSRATHGRSLSERAARDALLARNLAIVDSIVRPWERAQGARAGQAG
jgi:hypothetical protein